MYNSELISPRGCDFWMGRIAYDKNKNSELEFRKTNSNIRKLLLILGIRLS